MTFSDHIARIFKSTTAYTQFHYLLYKISLYCHRQAIENKNIALFTLHCRQDILTFGDRDIGMRDHKYQASLPCYNTVGNNFKEAEKNCKGLYETNTSNPELFLCTSQQAAAASYVGEILSASFVPC